MELGETLSGASQYLKVPGSIEQIFTGEEPQPKHWAEELEEQICSFCPACDYQTRIGGCLFMLTLGFFISLGSTFRLFQLIQGNPTPFAIMYTVGNFVSLSATCFMYGPWTQAKKMFAPTRFLATAVYFGFMFSTLFLAYYPYYVPLRGMLIVISVVLQFVALFWYTISFIPYAREVVLGCLGKVPCCQRIVSLGCCVEEEQSQPDAFWGGLA